MPVNYSFIIVSKKESLDQVLNHIASVDGSGGLARRIPRRPFYSSARLELDEGIEGWFDQDEICIELSATRHPELLQSGRLETVGDLLRVPLHLRVSVGGTHSAVELVAPYSFLSYGLSCSEDFRTIVLDIARQVDEATVWLDREQFTLESLRGAREVVPSMPVYCYDGVEVADVDFWCGEVGISRRREPAAEELVEGDLAITTSTTDLPVGTRGLIDGFLGEDCFLIPWPHQSPASPVLTPTKALMSLMPIRR